MSNVFPQDIKITEITPREHQIASIEKAFGRVAEPSNEKIQSILDRWKAVVSQVDMRRAKLEQTTQRFPNFQASIKAELVWLGHAEQRITSPEFQATPEEMESKITELTVSLRTMC